MCVCVCVCTYTHTHVHTRNISVDVCIMVLYGSIHPRYKQDIGRRLALSGLAVAYGEDVGRWQGPIPTLFTRVYNEIEIQYDEGRVNLYFKNGDNYDVSLTLSLF